MILLTFCQYKTKISLHQAPTPPPINSGGLKSFTDKNIQADFLELEATVLSKIISP